LPRILATGHTTGVLAVKLPLQRVEVDVLADAAQFILVAAHPFVIVALPD
jgi:hypothetical protein